LWSSPWYLELVSSRIMDIDTTGIVSHTASADEYRLILVSS
jgi:hypothetical protein